ncbi:MAG: response regulator [Burkholderiales bacterium]|nr:response regulator [Burkholderiales bacterium]
MAVKKILVVDDSPTERFFLQELLTGKGYSVITAENGEEAVTRANRDMPDLILMDIVMPGLNGFQATRQITRAVETAHIPVLICTTKDQETDKIWGVRQGAKGYLTKPIDAEALLKKIAEFG